ncbi:replication initiation protein [Enterococcus faecalis]|uniref:Replication protein Rep n=1 Tax=Enterococcus faecalis TaxID=1351 RepID=A0A7G8A8S2_ENTFL|nr:replication initiation protein [Enterococcus faecalis]KXF69144.1 initiator RepB protein [Enterococcus faecalis]KXF73732.1 initiator RepB protein [Enterococcus faecalis]MBC2812267.1 RepB family plasmid replication initiator protein [Enterococcus faecalis]MBC2818446.1 RepB family plasmid replication initiator protein [Enterococcus faecalis]MBC2820300.1 RepB family plasmid replication initiator protein [Enterococcus faecalis]
MSNEIVKYHHELNTIPLRKFTPVEMNLFFSIVSRMREKGDKTVRFTFDQLKDLSNYKATANNRFIDDLEQTYKKILSLRFGRRSESGLTREFFVMFTEFKINGDVEEPYVDIRIYEKALPLLNNLDEWVRYSLQQFNELQSSYSKTMFRLLKQFRTKGFAYFSKEDFHELLDIPKSYRESNIDQYVLKPIKQELTAIFKGLTIKKKYGKGRGKPVIGYQFTFKPEIKKADDFNKHAPTKEEQKRALTQANEQTSYEETPNTLNERIKQKQRELELLQQIQELEKEKEALEAQTGSNLSEKEKKSLLSDLDNLFN